MQEKSTSGGLVTGLLLHLLETGVIDGAILIASDEKVLWKGKPVVARTKEEILATVKSKYAISPTNSVFSEIRQIPGKYALVGLPCQIHGFEKAAKLDERIRERVVLTIGLFCHAAIEHEAFEIIWESLGDKADDTQKFISRIGKHPGAPHIELKDGSFYPVYFGNKEGYRPSSMEMINILYRLYTPPRCLTCFDALSEFADISVGDPWMAPPEDDVDFYKGWSFGLIRSDRGMEAYNSLLSSGKIIAKDVTVKEALTCNSHMSSEKRWRAFRVIETQRRQGKSIPSYGDFPGEFPKHSGVQFVKTEGHMLTHLFCFLPNYRANLLRFFLGNGGYVLLWLNNKRRTTKFFLRDFFARWRRKFFGRR
ncbi:MAG: Coenzyme F420 hydrogenase/dehydrogenase, beta subunit C-terminal domain [Bdellovibrionales bacterium]|nr:Coenzyme F420 hydrogenase/dehydrogenase, beta subunit C-terminal domain [Bdellovibrionales bacterium]